MRQQKPYIELLEIKNSLENILAYQVKELIELSGGDWSQAVKFITKDQEECVVRFSYSDEGFYKDKFAFENFKNIPIPEITDINRWGEYHYAISKYAKGIAIENLSQREFMITLNNLLRLLGEIRATDMNKFSGYGGWYDKGEGASKSWKQYLLQLSPEISIEDKDKATNIQELNKDYQKLYEKFLFLVNKYQTPKSLYMQIC